MKTSNVKKLHAWRTEQGSKSKKRMARQAHVSRNPGKQITILVEPEDIV